MRTLFLLGLSLALSGSACAAGRGRVALDPVTQSTAQDGDASAIIEGCGHQPIVGFTYCRVEAGSSASQMLSFIGPPSKCDQAQGCVYFKVWDGSGQVVWGGSIPKGQTRVSVAWSALLSGASFQVNHRGTWTWNETVYWRDTDGRERISKAQGDLVLRVYQSGYIPLQEVGSDPAFVWTWVDGNCVYKMTSGLRAYVKCGKL